MDACSSIGGAAIFQILVIVPTRILLPGIVQNFACNLLTFKDDIDIIFAAIA